ncbi:O-glucosyltransferase rumi homolog [Cajanus cajan]|uniref:CAP10 family protein CPIJ013394 family n=1 Tax=Cajanus cajan TaxID=3821 RepID=A0A151R506_CAJCA|nr:O-glucosyltransferase rumi homolog [Cajanus cajan]KYP37650.1 CAP10 family protein CPIJ013394 family [Cajanus cajan]
MRENNVVITRQENYGSGHSRHYKDAIWWPFMKSLSRSSAVIAFSVVLIVGALVYTRTLDTHPIISGGSSTKSALGTSTYQVFRAQIETPVNCSAYNHTRTCPRNGGHEKGSEERVGASATCPEYFRWIDEDLRAWARTGITREMVERARATANFRVVILNGRAYLETYEKAFQTRDVFTLWGILQMLRRYPGMLPDFELMFDCVDWPVVSADRYAGPNAGPPPPLFRYCGNDDTLDIVFPDWSYWGWPEVNIKPWEILLGELKEGTKRIPWLNREPYAYWKGNPTVAETRQDLMKCNVSDKQEWNARLYAQDWGRESQEGYKKSDLASQCTHRYKVYIEGSAWSVSEKYILSCDSVTLLVKPHYYDFFTRGLIPTHHYWPIKEDDKCRSIKFAVDWGNNHKQEAQNIGKAASDFVQEELKMDYVYDYMFHLLNSYAKLFKYKPSIGVNATELCVESMVCGAEGTVKKFMMESLVKGPSNTSPCTMPPPYDPPSLQAHLKRKEDSIQQVESWEKSYWEKQNRKS